MPTVPRRPTGANVTDPSAATARRAAPPLAPETPEEPRSFPGLFVLLAGLAVRWRAAVQVKGAAPDTAGALYTVACALAAIEVMLIRWGSREAERIHAGALALHMDAALARLKDETPPTLYAPPVDEAPLFAALRALDVDFWAMFAGAEEPDTRHASWACACAVRGLVAMVDRWGSPAAAAYRDLALDMAGPTLRAGLVEGQPAMPRSMLDALHEQVQDVIAAGLDATAPPQERDLGRRAARRIIIEAEQAIGALFALAAAQGEAT